MPVPRPVTAAGSVPVNDRDERRRRGGVGDAHVPGDQAPVPVRRPGRGRSRCPSRWRGAPPRALIAGPVVMSAVPGPDLPRQQPGRGGQGSGDPDVHDPDVGACLRGDRVDGRAAGQEVGHHLRGDLLRPRRHALGVHPVVGGEHRDDGGQRERRRALPGDPGELDRHVLEPPERPAAAWSATPGAAARRGRRPRRARRSPPPSRQATRPCQRTFPVHRIPEH